MPSHTSREMFLGLFLVLMLCIGSVQPTFADPARLSLDELRATVVDRFSSIRSLYVAHTFTRPASAGGQTEENVWAQQDSQVLFRTEYTDETIGYWLSYDGTRSYNVGYDSDRQPAQVELKDAPPSLGIICYFAKLFGWYIGQGESSLVDALAGDVELLDSDDENIYVVSAPNFVSEPNPTPLNVTFYLDARHGYLPRKVEFSDVANPRWKFTYQVDEFGRVVDAATRQELWFPMKGRYIQGTPHRGIEEFPLVATEVRINESLPSSAFVPEMPKGMSVIDNTEQGRGKFYVVGGYSSTDEHLERLATEAKDEVGIRNRVLVVALNVCFIIFVGMIVLLARRKRGSSSK